jgi:hypothetical protein
MTDPASTLKDCKPLAAMAGWALFPMVSFEAVELREANRMLTDWGHKMGPCERGNQRGWSHALFHAGNPVAVTIAATLIRERVGNAHHLTRENTIELARLCAARPGLCRVALRLWREFAFPAMGYQFAMSYQDNDLHNGNTYRFDGWQKVARSVSGRDTRSGREGRDKSVWQYPPNTKSSDAGRVR